MRFTLLLAAALFWPNLAAAAAKDPFLEAQDAFRRGDAKKLEALAPRLANHPLASYVEYYRLRMRIDIAEAREVEAFIDRHKSEYIGDAMRADRLKWLARKGQWEVVEREWPRLVAPDVDMRCLALDARRRRPDASVADAALAIWHTEIDLPEACEELFKSLFTLRLLPEKAAWQRARRHVAAGRTAVGRAALAYLPAARQPDGKTWQAITRRPAEVLARFAAKAPGAGSAEWAALAILALAAEEPEEAAAQLLRLQDRFSEEDRAALWASVALRGAMNHHPQAGEWFGRASGASMTDEQMRWRARAALRAGDFPRLRVAIEAMPTALATEPAWVYWLGRALAASGRSEAAQLSYSRIAGQSNFYGILAAEELGHRFEPPPRAAPPSDDDVARIGALGAVQRALALLKLDLRIEGVREWSWALAGMDDRRLLAAAEYARRNHVFDRAIGAADRTTNEHDYGLRFLTPYEDTIRPAAKAAQLDEAWVYGLIRQESRFVNVARSSAGAQGLMQLMPATARWVARKLGLADYRPDRINDVGTNLKLGTTYLRVVYESLDQSPVLASAAYNAGPNRARRWRDPKRALEGAVYAETIPFTETRDYVKKVMANAVVYSTLLNGRPDSLKARLGTIRPAVEAAPEGEELP